MSDHLTLEVQSIGGSTGKTVELPAHIFDAKISIPLLHQVVTAQLAAARQGTHAVKNRSRIRGGGAKPYRQKGTGRARQGSTRSPQFTGGAIAHGPVPRSYAQRTPKKMIAAALRGALSDRAQNEAIVVIDELIPSSQGLTKLTKTAKEFINKLTDKTNVLVVLTREEDTAWKAVGNLQKVHAVTQEQLNTYDVLKADTVIFSLPALHNFIEARSGKQKVGA